ncbi:MAG: dipeptide epimerase [Planctomycetaceae bacterium]|jgi:L-alanine-DL-glutamate epimerase-like enolase superfamily enzyme|nr:dipeptide epimerase [Planctomycetaceae bacterium]
MKLRIIRIDLPLKHIFTTSNKSNSVVRTIVVELEQDGLRGHGEVQEDLFYNETIESMVELLENCADAVRRYALADTIAFGCYIDPMFGSSRFARSAVDCAACDLWGKMKNKPLYKIWKLPSENLPLSSYSIGLDSLERMADRFDEVPDWPSYRIKLGDSNDMQILEMLRKKTNAPFRIDVNGGWNVNTAISYIERLKSLGVESIEQPLAPNNWEGMSKLRKAMKERNINIPIFADESWKTENDIERCVGFFDGLNIKLAKCGGLTPAREIIAKARQLGFKLTSANSVESTVGVSAIAQLASLFDYIAVDGPLQIEKKIGTGVSVNNGKLIFPKENGTGVRVVLR